MDNLIAQFMNKTNHFDNIGMIVGQNERLLSIHNMRDNHAQKAYKRAKELIEVHYPINDDDAFRKSFTGYLRKQIAKEKYITNIEQSINWIELDNLTKTYLEYQVNWDAYSYDLELINQSQVNMWKLCEKLCKTLNASKEISIDFGSISFLEFNGKWHPSFDEISMLK
jgi:hypothetical protein